MTRPHLNALTTVFIGMVLCGLSFAAPASRSGTNLLPNGNFELDEDADGRPDGWGTAPAGVSYEVEEGNRFLRLSSVEPGKLVLLYQQVSIPKEVRALTLSWRQRVTDLKPGKEAWFDARLLLDFKDADGKKLGSAPAPYARKDTDGWVDRTVRFLVPEGTRWLALMPSLFRVERGVLDLDDLTLTPMDAAALEAAARAAAEEARRAQVPPEAPKPDRWPKALHVEGKRIVDTVGREVWLQGVNVVSLEWSVAGEHVLRSIVTAVEDWNANLIRLPVKETYWFGRDARQKDDGAAYRALVDTAVVLAANRGAYLLLDLHRFQAPGEEHAAFWRDAAAHFKDHPAVLFDLFNEPHGIPWEVWRDGGVVRQKGGEAFQSVGMQALVDAVRGTGAKNVVVVGGLDWAYDLSGIANGFALEDKGGNGIVYATHIYPWKRNWQEKVLVAAERYPLLVGEVGADVKKLDFLPAGSQEDPYKWVPDMLGFIQRYRLHWTAFSFHPAASPRLLAGWDYTPTPFWGAFAKRALAGEQFPLTRMR